MVGSLRSPYYKERTIDRHAAARIVAEVEESGRVEAQAPTDLDLKKLARDLNFTWRRYGSAKFIKGATVARGEHKKRLNQIIAASARLRRLLQSDDIPGFPIWSLTFHRNWKGSNDDLDAILQALEEAAASVRDDFPNVYPEPPLQKLLGEWLPGVYWQHFGDRPTSGRNPLSGKINSPYVRFAMAVGREFGEQLSVESVTSYLYGVGYWKDMPRRR